MPLPSFSEDAGLDNDDEIEENYSEMRAQVQADSQRDDDEPEEETLQQQLAATVALCRVLSERVPLQPATELAADDDDGGLVRWRERAPRGWKRPAAQLVAIQEERRERGVSTEE